MVGNSKEYPPIDQHYIIFYGSLRLDPCALCLLPESLCLNRHESRWMANPVDGRWHEARIILRWEC